MRSHAEWIIKIKNDENLDLLRHVASGEVVHEWLADDEEHTNWYMKKFSTEKTH